MPVGQGRNNRKDNFREKVASTKVKKTTEHDKSPEVKKDKVPGLKLLAMLKEKNADKKIATKSEDYINSLSKVYVYLEDIKLDKKINNLQSSKRKSTRHHIVLEKDDLISNTEEMEVDSVESDISKVNVDTPKSSPKKSSNDTLNVKSSPKIVHSSIEEGIKNRNTRMTILNENRSVSTSKSVITKSADIPVQMEPEVEVITKTSKKRGRKPKLLKENEKKIVDESKNFDLIEKMDIPQVCLQNINLSTPKVKKSRLLIAEEELVRVNEVMTMDIDGGNICSKGIDSEKVEEQKVEVKKIGRRTIKLKDNDEPFVVEIPTISEKSKIPGLAFLQNLKNRKSEVIKESKNDNQRQHNVVNKDTKPVKVPGLSSIEDIRRRKSQLLSVDILSNLSGKEQHDTKVEEKSKPEIIPGLSSTAEIRRRKTIAEVSNDKEVMSTISEEKDREINSEIIPGVTSRQRKSIFDVSNKVTNSSEKVLEKISEMPSLQKVCEVIPTSKKTASYKVKSVLESSKVPGFSLIEEIRSRKSALPTPKKDVQSLPTSSTESRVRSSFIPTPSLAYPSSTTTLSSSIFKDTPSFTRQPLSSFSSNTTRISSFPLASPSILKTPISSLRTTDTISESSLIRSTTEVSEITTKKRPMSCISTDNEESEPRLKKAKPAVLDESIVSGSRRQSVTFNARVEVKEIKGNSFSSETGDGDHETVKDELRELERKVKENMQKTKLNLANKHAGESTSNIFSVSSKFQPRITTSTPTSSYRRYGEQNATPKSSGLSDYIIAKKKAQLEVSAEKPSLFDFNNQYSKSGVTTPQYKFTPSKVTSFSRSEKKEDLNVNNELSNEISDDEMDEEERNKKDKCTIL